MKKIKMEIERQILSLKKEPQTNLNLKLTLNFNLFLKFIKFSSFDLIRYIKEESQKNPFLSFNWEEGEIEKISYPISIHEKILQQLNLLDISEKKRKICEFIISNLEGNGYFKMKTETVSKILQVDNEEVEEALKIVQSFEPAGIGARNLQECFLIQIERYYKDDFILKKMVREGWGLLINRNIEKLAKNLKINVEDIKSKIKKLKKLVPNPLITESKPIKFIIPEGEIIKDGDCLKVCLKDYITKFLKIEFDYEKSLKSSLITIKEKKFLEEKIKRVKLIVELLEKRKKFLEKIFTEIVNFQKEYFKTGILLPLKEKDIAQKNNISISTVSRAVNNKYLISPKGIIKVRNLFTYEFKKTSISKDFIQKKIIEIIKSEKKPLSDKKIAEKLGYFGIKISARTVNKYRTNLGILNSYLRR